MPKKKKRGKKRGKSTTNNPSGGRKNKTDKKTRAKRARKEDMKERIKAESDPEEEESKKIVDINIKVDCNSNNGNSPPLQTQFNSNTSNTPNGHNTSSTALNNPVIISPTTNNNVGPTVNTVSQNPTASAFAPYASPQITPRLATSSTGTYTF